LGRVSPITEIPFPLTQMSAPGMAGVTVTIERRNAVVSISLLSWT